MAASWKTVDLERDRVVGAAASAAERGDPVDVLVIASSRGALVLNSQIIEAAAVNPWVALVGRHL
eukprot:10149976-Lingulodinium_polyedra.AAC.1